MKSFLIIFFIPLYLLSYPVQSDYRLNLDVDSEDEQKSGMKTKFSEWVPYKLNKFQPKFLEDYYELYGLNLHYSENDLRKDIYFLKVGLSSRFRHPRNALCEIKDEESYYKYRLLLTMHLNIQIMRAYMRIGSLFDKRFVYFQNLDFAYDLKKSFNIARGFYKEAIPYWKLAKENAMKASKIYKDINLGTLESERYEIEQGKLNFEYIIDDHLERLDKKQKMVEEYLKKNPDADKPLLDSESEENPSKNP